MRPFTSILRATLIACSLLASVAAADSTPVVDGAWRGQLGPLHLVVTFTRAADGHLDGVLDSVDQGAKLSLDEVRVSGHQLHFAAPRVGGVYEGTLDGQQLRGTWTQSGVPAQPLAFERVNESPATSSPSPLPTKIRPSPFDVEIPSAPIAFAAHGKRYLAYELHVTNLAPREVVLTDVEALDEAGTSVWRSRGADLESRVTRPGLAAATGAAALHLPPGTRGVIFAWIAYDSRSLPRRLAHRIGGQSADGTVRFVTPVAAVDVRASTLHLGPPLRGASWRAANGPSDGSEHRRSLMPIDGRAHLAQRFAIDWVKEGADGKTFTGDGKNNAAYLAYGSEVLAVADGTISEVKDGLPENPPGGLALPTTLETIAGNHILLDVGDGHRALYAHLQPGSLRVKRGDHVKRGQVLALVGNTGNSTEPHLHFQIADGDSPLGAEGVPYLLPRFFTRSRADAPRVAHADELPTEDELVDFE